MLTLSRYLTESRRWEAAVLAAVPLFAVYEAGLIFLASSDVRNAADVILKELLGIEDRATTLLLNTLVLTSFLATLALRRARRPPRGIVPLMVLESVGWAVLLAPLVLAVRDRVRLAAPGIGGTAAEQIVLGIGAGLYEELLFRLLLVGGVFLVLSRPLRMDPIWAAVVTLIGSSLLFSAYHHAGAGGEPWDVGVFVFRFLAGVVLGLLFLFRGLGVPCWAHAIYDVLWVLL